LFSDASNSVFRRVGLPVVALALVVTACTSKSGGGSAGGSSTPAGSSPASTSTAPSSSAPTSSSAPSSSAAALPLTLAASPSARQDVNPITPITVDAKNGTLTSVTLLNPEGKKVTGAMSADKASWHTTEVLGYSKSYSLVAKAADSSGERVKTLKRTFTTLTPNNMTMPYLDTVYGSSLENGATYGVGMIPVVRFDEEIGDKKAAEKAMQVTTTPHVDGAWYWLDNSTAHWRPKNYYAPGTKVTVAANVYGVQVGDGLYGQADQQVSFTIGAKHISIANAKTHKVKVYFSGKLVRTMNTSMGQGGTVKGKNDQTIYLWTMPGTYTVLGHENPATMSSDSYGLPANSPLGYAPEKVPFATKISTDGIYLHELDATVWAQGHQNVSHGCLNLNYDNASWFYRTSRVGDIVQVVHSGGPAIKVWQGGDWSVPWSTWVQGGSV